MAKIVVSGFGGMVPSGNPKLIPETEAIYCRNMFSRFGDLRPLKQDSQVATLPFSNAKTLYRMTRRPDGSAYPDGSTGWMVNSNTVSFVRGPVSGDNTERTYYTGDGLPKATDLSHAIRNLGVTPPEDAPMVDVQISSQITPEDVAKMPVTCAANVGDALKQVLPPTGTAIRYTPTVAGKWGAMQAVSADDKLLEYTVHTTNSLPTTKILALAYSPDLKLYVQVGEGGAVMNSLDGMGWAYAASGVTDNLNQVIWSPSRKKFFAVGNHGAFIWSADGKKWVSGHHKTVGNHLYDVVDVNGDLLMVGSSGVVVTLSVSMTDDVTLILSNATKVTVASNRNFYAISANSTYIICVGSGGCYTRATVLGQRVWSSVQLTTAKQDLFSTVWNGSNFIAVGNAGAITVSADGAIFTDKYSTTPNNLRRVTFGGGRAVATGFNGTLLACSESTGSTWATHSIPSELAKVELWAVMYSVDATKYFVGGGSGWVISSSDAEVWDKPTINTDTAFLLDAAIGGKYVDVVGAGTDAITVSITARPKVVRLDDYSDSVKSALLAITVPNTTTPLFTQDEVDAVVTDISTVLDVGCDYVKDKLATLDSNIKNWLYYIDNGVNATVSATALSEFYVTESVVVGIDNARQSLLDQMGMLAAKYVGAYAAGKPVAAETLKSANYTVADTSATATSLKALELTDKSGVKYLDVEGAKSLLKNWLTTQEQPYSTTHISVINAGKDVSILMPSSLCSPGSKSTYSSAVDYLVLAYATYLSGLSKNSAFPKPLTKDKLIATIHSTADSIKAIVEDLDGYIAANLTTSFLEHTATTAVDKASVTWPTAVTQIITTYAYVQTWVSDWGEESSPSPASILVTCDQNDIRTVSLVSTPPANVVGWRLYGSNVGSGSSAYQLITKTKAVTTDTDGNEVTTHASVLDSTNSYIPLTTTSVVDNAGGAYMEDVLPSMGWLAPPAGLKGLTGMPNGILVGFSGRTLYFCEPWRPYAWPADYDKPLQSQIVGIGAFGQTLFVGTEGKPYLVSGVDSGSMSEQLVDFEQSCVSMRSIVPFGAGVAYASPDGLCVVSNSGPPTVVTKNQVAIDKWRSYQPKEMFGVFHDSRIFMFTPNQCLVWDLEKAQLFSLGIVASAAFVDAATDTLYYVSGSGVYAMFGGSTNRTAVWHSKTWSRTKPISMSWLKINGDVTDGVVVNVYADEKLIVTHTFNDATPKRMPPGLYYDWRIEVETASDNVVFVGMTSTTQELQGLI